MEIIVANLTAARKISNGALSEGFSGGSAVYSGLMRRSFPPLFLAGELTAKRVIKFHLRQVKVLTGRPGIVILALFLEGHSTLPTGELATRRVHILHALRYWHFLRTIAAPREHGGGVVIALHRLAAVARIGIEFAVFRHGTSSQSIGK